LSNFPASYIFFSLTIDLIKDSIFVFALTNDLVEFLVRKM